MAITSRPVLRILDTNRGDITLETSSTSSASKLRRKASSWERAVPTTRIPPWSLTWLISSVTHAR